MKLAIISHTEHYTTEDGTLVGWSPTVNEINHLLEVFDTIYHLAMHYDGPAPKSVLAYTSDRIHFIPLPSVGGPHLSDKFKILWHAPKVIQRVSKVLKEVDYFQLRTPTGIGVFLIPYLSWFTKHKGWYKYAGNWNQKHPPLGYALQRWMLKQQSRKVTINGLWDHQPSHCLSFENPCLAEADLVEGFKIAQKKSIEGALTLCFVGRVEAEKGVGVILDTLQRLSDTDSKRIAKVHFVGTGLELEDYKQQSEKLGIRTIFHGSLQREAVFEIYEASHAMVLPTRASEGFPKVLAEAIAFGCIPIVSNLSAIAQYIKHGEQGFLLDSVTPKALTEQLQNLFRLNPENYHKMLSLHGRMLRLFTFTHYHDQIRTQILRP